MLTDVRRTDIEKKRQTGCKRMRTRLKPIEVVRSPFRRVEDVPRDCGAVVGEIEVFKEYEEGLEGVEESSHLIILWLFHKSKGYSLRVKPLHHEGIRGVFATRHPDRPNPIGFTLVELLERRGNVLRVRGITWWTAHQS